MKATNGLYERPERAKALASLHTTLWSVIRFLRPDIIFLLPPATVAGFLPAQAGQIKMHCWHLGIQGCVPIAPEDSGLVKMGCGCFMRRVGLRRKRRACWNPF